MSLDSMCTRMLRLIQAHTCIQNFAGSASVCVFITAGPITKLFAGGDKEILAQRGTRQGWFFHTDMIRICTISVVDLN